MSSQRGNVARSRPQRHQNAQRFRNDDSSAQRKKINAKVHEGLCQRCKEVLEWRVKFNKYKPLTQPKKCVKCLQKTVKDSYHVICKPCACELDLCAKCGKREEIVIPIQTENEPSRMSLRTENHPSKSDLRRNNRRGELEGGCEINLSDTEDEDEDLDLLVKQIKNLN
ncbi:uncharacterized protein C9orf85 homolog isoform X2 [Sceloporus undulatus]|uniref:uncharacterized protein C9orf85 homolog isoform X2 n=1 Tax=Sceloporus undulatus TaxID=8520 RepID=UPI001C4AC099|nr:uncharacterized protein C9orf85 homolog isoform X2 [Sceloporus undulatus]